MAKTIAVSDVAGRINRMLATGDKISQDAKQILCSLAEEVLMDTDNYKGFEFLRWRHGGCEAWKAAGMPEDKTPFMGPEYDRRYFC